MGVLYVDSSALLKRVFIERESNALRDLLGSPARRDDLLVGSSLVWLEVWRSARRVGSGVAAGTVRRAMAGIAELPLTDDILTLARTVGTDMLRSLDAIHLASALAVEASELVTYDARLADAATSAGIAVVAPA